MANEKRLIDAWKLVIDLARLKSHGEYDHEDVMAAIASQETVNVVEVVRCGACKEWLEIEETGGAGYCHHPCWMIAGVEPPIVQFADFCSYGERKSE